MCIRDSAKVSLEHRGRIGPARVSLCNRLSLLEAQLAENPSVVRALIDEFDKTRHLGNMLAAILGFQATRRCLRLAKGCAMFWLASFT
eukprot:2732114-Alexandrium_andersonii.AAC.1